MKIINVVPSPKNNKRFMAIIKDNNKIKKINFGDPYGSTYIDNHNAVKRHNYWKRHYNNPREQPFLENLIMSPALLSAYILWGESTSMKKNIDIMNEFI